MMPRAGPKHCSKLVRHSRRARPPIFSARRFWATTSKRESPPSASRSRISEGAEAIARAIASELSPAALGLDSLAAASEVDLEHQLGIIREAGADNRAGVFGPSSVMWRLDKEAGLFLGAGRALLLPLAHPWVATAISRYSRVLADPIDRFHGTFKFMFTMVFGTTEQALAMARRLHQRHEGISGRLAKSAGPFAAGSQYRANEVAALRWVHATLIDTTVVACELLYPRLSVQEREHYLL